ncbi:MAG: biliverdin-producing heme oxygenase [Myxococcota bacterium]
MGNNPFTNQMNALSAMLRQATAIAHRNAENRRFVRALLKGQISQAVYARYLTSLVLGYRVLEDALQRDAHPTHHPFRDPALYRVAPLIADIQHYAPRTPPAPVRAAMRWADHLQQLREDAPVRLLSHLYTRYLGDLSGGQIIGERLIRVYGLSDHRGVQFYDFPQIADTNRMKQHLRSGIDAVGASLHEAEQQAVLDEAVRAFEMSAAIFDDLS